MKQTLIEELILEILDKSPKNKHKCARNLAALLVKIAEGASQKYYKIAKHGVFKTKDVNPKAFMDICEAKKEEYKKDPMALVYDIEDEIIRQIEAFYGKELEE